MSNASTAAPETMQWDSRARRMVATRPMEWLNYHHLFHFHAVAREGSVTRAAKSLRLAPATVSMQLRALEAALGHPLFERVGRSLVVTEQGRVVQRYAEEIFGLGREMKAALSGRADDRTRKVRVGVAGLSRILAMEGAAKGVRSNVVTPFAWTRMVGSIPMTGAVLNTLNTRLDAEAIAFMLDHGQAKVLLTDREFAATIEKALTLVRHKPLVIDVDVLDANLRTMAAVHPGAALRPHVKAHKCTSLALRQAAHGHTAFTCATPREVILAQAERVAPDCDVLLGW